MSPIRVDDLHEAWKKDPRYRREYEALEEEFSIGRPDRGPHPRRHDPRTGGEPYEDDSGRNRPVGRRGKQTVYPHA